MRIHLPTVLASTAAAVCVASFAAPADELQPIPRPPAQARIEALIKRVDHLQNLEARHHAAQDKRLARVEADSDEAYDLANYAAWATDCISGGQWVTTDEGSLVYTDASSVDNDSTLLAVLDEKCLAEAEGQE